MRLRSLAMLGITALSLGVGITVTEAKASAHSFFYWEHPHWVTLRKTMTIAKIKNVYPLYKSYKVEEWGAYRGYHLKIHHVASYSWQIESGKFNSGYRYTYVVIGGRGTSWFRQGIY